MKQLQDNSGLKQTFPKYMYHQLRIIVISVIVILFMFPVLTTSNPLTREAVKNQIRMLAFDGAVCLWDQNGYSLFTHNAEKKWSLLQSGKFLLLPLFYTIKIKIFDSRPISIVTK